MEHTLARRKSWELTAKRTCPVRSIEEDSRIPLYRKLNSTNKENEPMGHGLIAWIFIGIVAGWLTGKLMKGSGFGMIMDMVVGLIGALIGGFLSSHLGFGGTGDHGLIGSIVIAVIGAVVLTLIVRLVSGNRTANL
jgi:uncharacterized membrane protein YeaQ/YmgE (transglycosylase-associated protein family)